MHGDTAWWHEIKEAMKEETSLLPTLVTVGNDCIVNGFVEPSTETRCCMVGSVHLRNARVKEGEDGVRMQVPVMV